MKSKPITFKYYSDLIGDAIYSAEGSQPQSLYAAEQTKVLTTALEPGQKIPLHPEGLVVYIFLKGNGWMTIEDERLRVNPGTTIIALAGAHRGIEAESWLVLVMVRTSDLFK